MLRNETNENLLLIFDMILFAVLGKIFTEMLLRVVSYTDDNLSEVVSLEGYSKMIIVVVSNGGNCRNLTIGPKRPFSLNNLKQIYARVTCVFVCLECMVTIFHVS